MNKIFFCIRCQKPLIVTVQMQYVYNRKNFPLPKRCPQCLEERRNNRKREVECQRKRLWQEGNAKSGDMIKID